MTDQEHLDQAILSLKELYPVGKLRWVQIKFTDFEKVMKAFRPSRGHQRDTDRGYEVHAVDEFTPGWWMH